MRPATAKQELLGTAMLPILKLGGETGTWFHWEACCSHTVRWSRIEGKQVLLEPLATKSRPLWDGALQQGAGAVTSQDAPVRWRLYYSEFALREVRVELIERIVYARSHLCDVYE
eukprot:4344401-Pyramimonas_sp.AAC.1